MSDADRYLPPGPSSPRPPKNTALTIGITITVLAVITLAVIKEKLGTPSETQGQREKRELREFLEQVKANTKEAEEREEVPAKKEKSGLLETMKYFPQIAMPAVQVLMGELEARLAFCRECHQRLNTEVSFRIADLKDRQALEVWRERAKEQIGANREVLAFLGGMETRFAAELKKVDLAPEVRDLITTEFAGDLAAMIPIYRRIHGAGEGMGQNLIALCEFAEKEWGKWSVDGEKITFQTPGADVTYHRIHARRSELAAEAQAAEDELMKVSDR